MKARFLRKPVLALLAAGLSLLAAFAAVLAVPTTPAPSALDGRFVVHEWGTFLSVQGSDGTTLGGMVDSEDQLPTFVRERSLGGISRARFRNKAETPVTYFYTDRPRRVRVRVDMPEGLLTHWFPSVRAFGPPPLLIESPDGRIDVDYQAAEQTPGNSFLDWAEFDVVPAPLLTALAPSFASAAPRQVAADDHWRFARATDAALVRIGPENEGTPRNGDWEKFLFYRGLGTFDLPLHVSSGGCCRTFVTLANRGKEVLGGIHLIRVTKGEIEFAALPDLAGSAEYEVKPGVFGDTRQPLSQGVAKVKASVAAALTKAGLYPKEALAMVNTWERSYFQTEGVRVLYVVPRSLVDAIFPLHVKPSPQELVRVMAGRVEVLRPEREHAIERAVADMNSRDPVARKAAKVTLERLGRIREPALRRIASLTQQPEVRAQVQEMLRRPEAKGLW